MANNSSTEKMTAHCGIYDHRPQVCRDYPKIDQYMPEECTFTFNGSERRGECACGTAVCCNTPRQDGEPGGVALPTLAGGKSCKHLAWKGTETPLEKEASGQNAPLIQSDIYGLVGGPSDT